MPVAWFALHLPALLLRLLRLLLPSRPFPVDARLASVGPMTTGIQPSLPAAPPAAPRYRPKCAPARVRSFLEETPFRARDPEPAPPAASPAGLHPVPSTSRTRIAADSSERRAHWRALGPLPGWAGIAGSRRPLPAVGGQTPPPALAPALKTRRSGRKNAPKPSLASPTPLGSGWRERVPPYIPTLRHVPLVGAAPGRGSFAAVNGTMSVRPRRPAPSYPKPR